jgi:RES domain-containing protein
MMEVFRICKAKYASSLLSSGVANRWNSDGEYVIYTGGSRSLSSLELIVHKNAISISASYHVMVISIPETEDLLKKIEPKDLPNNWRREAAYTVTQQMGSDWYRSNASLVLQVPSAIMPYEHNFVINTRHPSFVSKVKLLRQEDFFWDERLFK